MKVRTGFVSNSSSSSFVIAKCYMTEEQVKEFSRFLNESSNRLEDNETYIEETEYYFAGEVSYHEPGIYEFLAKINVDKKYIGTDWCSIPDDVTPKATKEKTANELKILGVKTEELSVISEGWYDG